jgi:hypothetical protein
LMAASISVMWIAAIEQRSGREGMIAPHLAWLRALVL